MSQTIDMNCFKALPVCNSHCYWRFTFWNLPPSFPLWTQFTGVWNRKPDWVSLCKCSGCSTLVIVKLCHTTGLTDKSTKQGILNSLLVCSKVVHRVTTEVAPSSCPETLMGWAIAEGSRSCCWLDVHPAIFGSNSALTKVTWEPVYWAFPLLHLPWRLVQTT